jgi:hypothetical protein
MGEEGVMGEEIEELEGALGKEAAAEEEAGQLPPVGVVGTGEGEDEELPLMGEDWVMEGQAEELQPEEEETGWEIAGYIVLLTEVCCNRARRF